jgi:hypothetical protein
MHPIVESKRLEVADLCRRRHVRRLEVFGSATRDDFDEARSDIDVLVEFDDAAPQSLTAFFDLKDALEQVFGRPVDLVMPGAIRNPYVRATINRDRQVFFDT